MNIAEDMPKPGAARPRLDRHVLRRADRSYVRGS